MPIYVYEHPETKECVEILQGMNEAHEYQDEDGVYWNRVFTSPNAAIDLDSDPFSHSQFVEKTKNGGTMGDLWDRSAEMSAKRAAQSGGVDPYKKQYFKDYSSKRGGEKHLSDPTAD